MWRLFGNDSGLYVWRLGGLAEEDYRPAGTSACDLVDLWQPYAMW